MTWNDFSIYHKGNDHHDSSSNQKSYRPGVGAVIFNREKKILLCQRLSRDKNYVTVQNQNFVKEPNQGAESSNSKSNYTIPATLQFPQGGIDHGEKAIEALEREMQEELGLNKNFTIIAESSNLHSYDFPAFVQKKVYRGKYVGQNQKWFLLYFYGDDCDINISDHLEPEFSAFYWLDLSEAVRYAIDFKKPLYARLVDEFGPIIQNYTIPV